MLIGKTVVLGVTGGIAAWQVPEIIGRLRDFRLNVYCIMTKSATQFIAPLTLQVSSQNPVAIDMFERRGEWNIAHIALADIADLFLIAPATANIIAKLAHGIADDLLSTTVLATRAPVAIAPAMNPNMYSNQRMHYIDDALGICAGLSSFPLKPPYHIHNYPLFISSGAGIDMDEEGLTKVARRNRQLVRANNIRRGMRRADEKPPEDHWKKRFPELEEALLDGYYKFKGWNRDGIPTRETLKGLDLDYVAKDFEQRGILKNEQG